jgi:hypothetical protein
MKLCVAICSIAWLGACSPDAASCPFTPFVRTLTEIAGQDARKCGLVPFTADASGARACATEMLTRKKPFFVGFWSRGIDSDIWEGVALDPNGRLSVVHFDSGDGIDLSGGGCPNPRTTVTRCTSVLVIPDEAASAPRRPSPLYCLGAYKDWRWHRHGSTSRKPRNAFPAHARRASQAAPADRHGLRRVRRLQGDVLVAAATARIRLSPRQAVTCAESAGRKSGRSTAPLR